MPPDRARVGQFFAGWHGGRQGGHPGQRHRLCHTRDGELTFEHGGGRRESRYTRYYFVVDTQRVESAALFGERAVERRVTGVQPRHIMPGGVGVGEFGDDLIQRQRPGVNDFRVGRAQRQQIVGHDRTRIQADPASAEQALSADGDQVCGPGARADKVHRHFVITHCVTGSCGRQPVRPPSGSP